MKRLLIVHGDRLFLKSLETLLKGKVQTLGTTSANAAAKVLEVNTRESGGHFFDALLTDCNMREMSGLTLARKARDAGVKEIMIMTGGGGADQIPMMKSRGFHVFEKPIDDDALCELLGVEGVA